MTNMLLTKWARAGLIDTVLLSGADGNFDWHFRMLVPTRAVWTDLPEFFDSAIIDIPGNIQGKDIIVFEVNPDGSFKEAIIPDSLYFEQWIYSEKTIQKFKKKKQNNNDFLYHNLSPGFKPAKHKDDLDDKAKKEKEKKEKKNG